MVLNGLQQNSCGNSSSAKCSTCNLKFFCSKSPHCSITHIDDNFDAISRFISGFYNQYQNDITTEKEVFSQIQQLSNVQDIKISELKNDYDSKYVELSNKLDQILFSLNNKSISNENVLLENEDVEIINKEAIALYDGGKKYVEKKNLFGKTKWVEDK